MLKFPPPLTLASLMNRFAVVCEIKCKIYLICVKCHCWTVVICGLCENKQGDNRRKGAAHVREKATLHSAHSAYN